MILGLLFLGLFVAVCKSQEEIDEGSNIESGDIDFIPESNFGEELLETVLNVFKEMEFEENGDEFENMESGDL